LANVDSADVTDVIVAEVELLQVGIVHEQVVQGRRRGNLQSVVFKRQERDLDRLEALGCAKGKGKKMIFLRRTLKVFSPKASKTGGLRSQWCIKTVVRVGLAVARPCVRIWAVFLSNSSPERSKKLRQGFYHSFY